MGLRGPLRDPESRRGKQEARKGQVLAMVQGAPVAVASPAAPVCDSNLPARVQEIYGNLMAWAIEAKTRVKQIDSVAFTQAARGLYAIERAESVMEDPRTSGSTMLEAMKMMQTADRSIQNWFKEIGASPAARARMGQKPEPEKRGGAIADLIARRNGRQA